MRWLALLLLLIAAPVSAERASLMLVRQPPSSQIPPRHEDITWMMIQGICKRWDIDYVVVPFQATDTSAFRHGIDANGVAHEGVVHVAWVQNRYPRADRTTLTSRWPTVDTYFMGYGASTGFQDAAGCSTGIRSVNGDGFANVTHMVYEVNGPAAMRDDGTGAGQAAVTPRTGAAYGPGYIWRPLLGVAAGIADSGMVAAGTGTVATFTRRDDPDTVMAWFRQMVSGVVGGAFGPRIYFTQTGATGNGQPEIDVVSYTLAKMDSSIFARTGKRLINRKVRAGMVVEKWMGAGHYGWFTSNDTMTVGPFCPANANCDSAQVKASLDSLGSLNVPITFAVDVDSLDHAAYQWQEVAMRTRVPKYRVAWQSHAGMIGANGANAAGGSSGTLRILDVWGHHRLRTFIPPGYAGGLNPTDFNLADCSFADSSIVCLALRADSIMHARYPGKVDHLVHAARDDWTPRQINRTGAGAIDTLMSIANIAHVKGFRTNVDFSFGSDPGRVTTAAGVAAPWGYGVTRQEFPVYENPNRAAVGGPGRLLTRIVTVPTRNTVNFNARADNPLLGHNVRSELMWGFWTGQWYFDPTILVTYFHNFQARPLIFKINASALGNRSGAGGAPVRASLWGALQMARNFDMHNRAAGRTVMEIVPCDQLVNE